MFDVGEIVASRYRVLGVLGSGGFATVYDAIDEGAGRHVAIKAFTAATLSDRALRGRFERELHALARLRDPATVRLLTYGWRPDGGPFLVLEHVPGEDLAALLAREGHLEPDIVLHIARQLLAALREAHAAGVVHRDLKPQNVRVFTYEGDRYRVKLLDFGIARSMAADAPSLTQTGAIVGTPRYMPPEQLRGEPIDPTADLYSLGLMMVEMLAGHDSLSGYGLFEQVERLRTGHQPSVDHAHLGPVLARMCAADRGQRYASAQAVLAALDAPVRPSVPPPAPEPQVGAPEVPHARLALASLAALVLIATAVVALLLLRDRPAPPPPRPTPPPTPVAVEVPEPPDTEEVVEETIVEEPVAPPPPDTCATEEPRRGRVRRDQLVGINVSRWTRYVPKSYVPGTPHPLVIALPQRIHTADEFSQGSGFEEVAEEAGFVLVTMEPTPQGPGTFQPWAVAAALASEREELCLDRARTFLVGHGTGGDWTLRMACEIGVTAIAASSARPSSSSFECHEPLPALVLSPMHSDYEPVEGGRCSGGVPKVPLAAYVKMWRRRNKCSGDPRVVLEHEGSVCEAWDCAAAPFQHCRLDGGHRWPGMRGVFRLDHDCNGPATDFPAAEHVWRFFSEFR